MERVTDEGETIEIVKDGHVVAQLVPVEPRERSAAPSMAPEDANAEHEAVLAELGRIGQQLSGSWPTGRTAVDAIRAECSG